MTTKTYSRTWGFIEKELLKPVKCPKCGVKLTGRIGGDNKIELPNHGKTIELECSGGWYKIKENHV